MVFTIILSFFSPVTGQLQSNASTMINLEQPVQNGNQVELSFEAISNTGEFERFELVKNGEIISIEPTLVSTTGDETLSYYSYVYTDSVESNVDYTYQLTGYIGETEYQSNSVSITTTETTGEETVEIDPSLGDPTTEVTPTDEVVTFNDQNLELVLKELLGLSGASITVEDLTQLTVLNLEDLHSVTDLTGLEYAVNLESLVIDSNPVEDFTPLQGLPRLKDVVLINTSVTNLDFLLTLPSLGYVYLESNQSLDLSNSTIQEELMGNGVIVDNFQNGNGEYNSISLYPGYVTESSIELLWEYHGLQEIVKYVIAVDGSVVHEVSSSEGNVSVIEGLEPQTLYSITVEGYDAAGNLIADGMTSLYTESEPTGEVVSFPDAALDQAIREELGIGERAIYTSDLEDLYFLYLADKGITDLSGIEKAVNLFGINLNYNPITDISVLKNLPSLQSLDLSNTDIVDFSPLTSLTNLTFLDIGSTNVTDISFLLSMTNLTYVYLNGAILLDYTDGSADMQVINKLLADGVEVEYNPNVNVSLLLNSVSENSIDVSWYYYGEQDVNTYKVYLNNQFVTETSNRNHTFSNLQPETDYQVKVVAYNQEGIIIGQAISTETTKPLPSGDLVAFADPKLESLIKERLGLEREVYASDMLSLTFLHAAFEGLESLSGLEYAKNLETLYVPYNDIQDLSPLNGLEHLSYLSVSDNPISDFTSLATLPALEDLDLSSTGFGDLTLLKQLLNLQYLSIADNNLSDLTPLANLTGIISVDLANNNISDLTPLASVNSLEAIDVTGNNVVDLSPVQGLSSLNTLVLTNNPITNIDTLQSMTQLRAIELSQTMITSIEALRNHTQLDYLFLNGIGTLDFTEGSITMEIIQNLIAHNVFVEYSDDFGLEVEINKINEQGFTAHWFAYEGSAQFVELYLDGELIDVVEYVNPYTGDVTDDVYGDVYEDVYEDVYDDVYGPGYVDYNFYTFTGLNPDTNYEFEVVAYDANGEVVGTQDAEVTTLSAPTGDIIEFNDENLKAAIQDNLGVARDIYKSDMERFVELDLSYYDITDLTGLEHAVNLVDIYLYNNNIADISPLANLTKLTFIDLENNQISDVKPLVNISGLTVLLVSGNPISSISDLVALTNLEALILDRTNIENINTLLSLPNLYYVSLMNMTALDFAEGSQAMNVINTLVDNGVYVDYGTYEEDPYLSLYVDGVTETTIDISWNLEGNSDLVTNYNVYLDGQLIDEVDATVNSYSFASLLEYTEYEIRVEAVLDGNDSISSETVFVTTEQAPTGDVVTFNDEKLEAAVRDALMIPSRDIYVSDLESLTYLYASNLEITDLTGLEFAVNLESLHLDFNQITDVTPLAGLTSLTSLSLWGNEIVDVTPLANLVNLTYLDLDGNKVSTISPLSGLANLEILYLFGNPLDLSVGSETVEIIKSFQENGTYVSYGQEPEEVIETFVDIYEVTDTTATVSWYSSLSSDEISHYTLYVNGEVRSIETSDTFFELTDLSPSTSYEVELVVTTGTGEEYTAYNSFTTNRAAADMKDVKLKAVDQDGQVLAGFDYAIEGQDADNQDVYVYGYTNSNGFFRDWYSPTTTLKLPAGTYEVIIYGQNSYDTLIEEFIVTESGEHVFTVEKLQKETTSYTVKLTSNGEPVTNVEYMNLYSWDTAYKFNYEDGYYYANNLENENGEYVFENVVQADDYYLNVYADGYMTYYSETAVAINEINNEITIELEKGATIKGKVVDSNGQPVIADLSAYGNQSYQWGQVGDEGNFELGGLRVENLTLDVYMQGFLPKSITIQATEFNAEDVIDVGTIVLESEKFVHGKVYKENGEPAKGASVYLYQGTDSWNSQWTRTDSNGYFKIRNVAEGTYTLKVEGYDLPSVEKTNVTTDGVEMTITLEAPKTGSFSGVGNSFAAATQTVTPGESFDYRLNYKNNGTGTSKNVEIGFNLPAGVELIEQSVLVDGVKTAVVDGKVTLSEVPAGKAGNVSFKAKVADTFNHQNIVATATIKAGVEQTHYTSTTNVLFVSLNAPEQTAESKIKVYGEAKDNATVTVYADGKEVAKITSAQRQASGRWWYADITLPVEVGVESTHQLDVKVESNGMVYSLPTKKTVKYSPSIPKLTDVTVGAGWNGDVKLNPYTGVATFAITEYTPMDVEVKFDKDVEEANIYFLGETYELTKSGDYYVGNIPGTWSSYGEQLLEIGFTVDGQEIRLPLMEIIVLIDPSGYVFEGSMDNRLSGVQAVVEEQQVDGKWRQWNALMFNGQINPQITDEEGRYGWVVPEGNWRVIFSKDGYDTYTSRTVVVPPAETQLNVPLVRTSNPTIDSIAPSDTHTDVAVDQNITVSFDRLMNEANVNSNIQVIKVGDNTPVSGTFTLEGYNGYKQTPGAPGYYEEDATKKLSKTFVFNPTSNLDPEATYQIVVRGTIQDYAGKALGTDQITTFTTAKAPVTPEQPGNGGTPGTGEQPGNGGTPGTGGQPTNGGTPATGGQPSNGGTPSTGDQPSAKPTETDKESGKGNSLPKTATTTYNWLLAGIAFLSIGLVVLMIQRRRLERE